MNPFHFRSKLFFDSVKHKDFDFPTFPFEHVGKQWWASGGDISPKLLLFQICLFYFDSRPVLFSSLFSFRSRPRDLSFATETERQREHGDKSVLEIKWIMFLFRVSHKIKKCCFPSLEPNPVGMSFWSLPLPYTSHSEDVCLSLDWIGFWSVVTTIPGWLASWDTCMAGGGLNERLIDTGCI